VAGILLLAAGLLGLLGCALRRERRFLALAFALCALAPVLHPYRESRFLFLAPPLLALGAASLLAGERPERRPLALGIALALALCAADRVHTLLAPGGRIAAEHTALTLPPVTREALDAVWAQALPGPGRAALAGYWNGLSPALLEWHERRCQGRLPAPVPRRLHAKDPLDCGAAPGLIFVRPLADGPGNAPRRAAMLAELPWLEPALVRVEADPMRLPAGRFFSAAAGYEVLRFDCRR
jgi:hypothetical protein